MKNLYETIVIFDPTVRRTTINRFEKLLQEFTGKDYDVDVDEIGIKELAYEIKSCETGVRVKKGNYVNFTWAGTKENAVELEKRLKMDDEVLKFLTQRKETMPEEELEPATVVNKKPEVVDVLNIIYGLTD